MAQPTTQPPDTAPERTADAGPTGASERVGYRILFATDGSEEAEAAGRFLARLPLPPGSAIRALTVVDAMGWPETPTWYLESGRDWAQATAGEARASLARDGVEVTDAVRFGARGHEIIQAAEEFRADLLVIAAHQLSRFEAIWLGSITRSVAKHARCPVLVAREPASQLRRVVLAVDDSEHASQAVELVAQLPLPSETEVTVLHVVRPYQPFPGLVPSDPVGFQREVESMRRELQEAASELVERARLRLAAAGKQAATAVQEGDPAAEVMKLAASQEADLIVLGARGISLIPGLILGSVADRVLENAACSVILVR